MVSSKFYGFIIEQVYLHGHCGKFFFFGKQSSIVSLNIVSILQKDDFNNVKTLLLECFEYYQSLKLSNDCINFKCQVPPECTQHNAVYNILHYLVDIDFIKTNVSINIFLKILVFYRIFSLSRNQLHFSVQQ